MRTAFSLFTDLHKCTQAGSASFLVSPPPHLLQFMPVTLLVVSFWLASWAQAGELKITGMTLGQSAEVHMNGKRVWFGYAPQSGEITTIVPSGPCQIQFTPGMMGSFDNEVLCVRNTETNDDKVTIVDGSMPKGFVSFACEFPANTIQYMLVRLEGCSPETQGIRRWYSLRLDSGVWKGNFDHMFAGCYKCFFFGSRESGRLNDPVAMIRFNHSEGSPPEGRQLIRATIGIK